MILDKDSESSTELDGTCIMSAQTPRTLASVVVFGIRVDCNEA